MYYVYMLRCEDSSIYTGIAKDIDKRLEEHFSKDEKCAKYTKSHSAEKLDMLWQTDNKSNASKLEYAIKTLTKDKKEQLIKKPKLLGEYFKDRLDIKKYITKK